MNGMEKITARMKEDAARSLSELNAQTEQELRRIREESAARAEKERETAGGARISPRRSATSASAPRRRWRHAS